MHSLVLSKAQNRTQSPVLCPREVNVLFYVTNFCMFKFVKFSPRKPKSIIAFKGWVNSVLGLYINLLEVGLKWLTCGLPIFYVFISSVVDGCVLVVSNILNVKPINLCLTRIDQLCF